MENLFVIISQHAFINFIVIVADTFSASLSSIS